jgi:hypothetical protein
MNQRSQSVIIAFIPWIIWSLLACGAGFAGHVFGIGMWTGAVGVFVVGGIIGTVRNWIQHERDARRMYLSNMDIAAAIRAQEMWVECAYCHRAISVPVSIDNGTIFKCPDCDKSNRLAISIGTIQITEPIDSTNTIPASIEQFNHEPNNTGSV